MTLITILHSHLKQAWAVGPVILLGAVRTLSTLRTCNQLTAHQLTLYAAFILSRGVYNVYFHPLHKFPGPKLAGATDLVSAFYAVRGLRSKYNESLHAKYGPVVRTKPNELSFISEDAWKDIYMHRQGHKQMAKAGRSAGLSIIVADDDAHARQR